LILCRYHVAVTGGDSNPSDDNPNPFAGIPFLADLTKLMASQGGGSMGWDAARQMAMAVASGGESEPNVEPAERIKWESLARVADLQVASATGLPTTASGLGVTIRPVNRTQWVQESLSHYQPLFERLAESLGSAPSEADPNDMTAGLMALLAPMMLSMTAGSMIGHLATTSFGQYDLPLPRDTDDALLVVPDTVTEFSEEWSLDHDDLRLWICIHEVTFHTVFGVAHVRERLVDLLATYAGGFQPDPNALGSALETSDPLSDPGGLEAMFGDPEMLLGAVQSPLQLEILAELEALIAVLIGYVDHIVDTVAETLLGSPQMITEALQRRRVTATSSDRFVEKLLGMELSQQRYDEGAAFVNGVVERSGTDALARLWESAEQLPTPPEVAAPGLWLARIDLPAEPREPPAPSG
jgi:putative hydrolase